MKVLVVGSGGREHALCWAISASPLLEQLYCAPGNGGIAEVATCIDIKGEDLDSIVGFAREKAIDLVVVGPEVPLVAGLADKVAAAGIKVFGPSRQAAMIEGSKAFMKDLCTRHGVPTAAYGEFTEIGAAEAFIRSRGAPIVVKADGLAAGKGVVVAATVEEAVAAAREMLAGQFGASSAKLVIEEFLPGEELSFHVLVDGRNCLPLATAQDHKRVHDGDRGPNTGGMGTYSPSPAVDAALEREIMERLIRPVVAGMAAEGRPFQGVLYAGIMLTPDGPKIYEFNCRFGDPECQVLMARLQSDLLPALIATADGVLDHFDLRWRNDAAVCVVMAADGYPGEPLRGTEIRGLDRAGAQPGVTVFHAGTKKDGNRMLANGGRVLGVTATGTTVAAAQARAYQAVDLIDWPQGFCRRDIGWRAIEREKRK
ncbi:phosphoribosylamine--glycine ligase [Desertibaculum subflavum]|uniref:phosphoribosylamine--glycine ligase n=1 Tax=Desertibaculum subflavum TaxID=2268458 RepID=UPI000E66D015